MPVIFFPAKNNNRTCSVNGKNLHSLYNPEKEADRFVASLTCNFKPVFVVITEPALSWAASPLRNRFPEAKLCAIRYSSDFSDSDTFWDLVFNGTTPYLSSDLFNKLGEEGIYMTLFISWQPSACAYPDINNSVWTAIRQAVLKSKSILTTRSFFSERWLKNICHFCKTVQNTLYIHPGDSCILVAASGPSLQNSFPMIKKHRTQFFLIAVSSALEPLLATGIIPDLCLSTDGGYYAKRHLEILKRTSQTIPVALIAEAASPTEFTGTCPIVPLTYNTSPEKEFLACCGIQAMSAERNGTVSGTAVKFALSITSGLVICCGLDLSPVKGYQHTQPNALERDAMLTDNRIYTQSLRLTAAGLPSGSMDIYRNWFKEQPETVYSRVFRVSDHYHYTRDLYPIGDLNWETFPFTKDLLKPYFIKTTISIPPAERVKRLTDILQKEADTEQWLDNAFPVDYLLWKRSISVEDSLRNEVTLKNKNSTLRANLERVLYA